MPFLVLLLVLLAIASGALVTYLYDDGAPLASRLCAGAVIGFAALALIGFLLASAFGLNTLTLILSAVIIATPFALFAKPEYRISIRADIDAAARGVRRAVLHPNLHTTAYVIFYALICVLLWHVFDRVMFEKPDGIYTGFVNNLGDLPFHLQVISSFAYDGNFPPEDPTYAGARFAYPFLSDFIAAMFVRAGASLRQSMFVENFVLALALVGVLHRWTLELTRDRIAGLLAPLLVLLSGGLGWWLLFRDAREGGNGIFAVLKNLPHDYTIVPSTTFRWGNAITTLLVTQRSILFGLPLAITIFTQWWRVEGQVESGKWKVESENIKGETEKKKGEAGKRVKGERAKSKKQRAQIGEQQSQSAAPQAQAARSSFTLLPFDPLTPSSSPLPKRMIAAGVMAGMLPLIHAHSFIVVMGVAACLALIFRRWRAWAFFFAVALVIAAPEMWLATHGSQTKAETFLGWSFGWDHGEENVFWFWFKNTGLFIPLLVWAILWRKKEHLIARRLLFFYLPFALCFIIPNLIKLAPWVWDNIKVLFYWYVASVPLVALLLARLWREGAAHRVLAIALFVALTLAGSLDVWRVLTRTNEYREFDRNAMALAAQILQRTPQRSLILHAPTYNSATFLTGRRSFLGYTGQMWSRGLDYIERENEIKRIYAGAPDAPALMARHGIEYVVTSPIERDYLTVNDAFFERYTKVGEAGDYRLYKISRP